MTDANATPRTIQANALLPGPIITGAMALWNHWGAIAIEHEQHARRARSSMIASDTAGSGLGPYLEHEFRASLVGVAASAHALDALYGQLITPQLQTSGAGDKAGRAAHIRECLNRRFRLTNGIRSTWKTEFAWLFDLRDAAVHAEFEFRKAVPHPSGVTNSLPILADYCVENVGRGLDLLLAVLDHCTANPKLKDSEALAWAQGNRHGFDVLTKRRQDGLSGT